MEGPVIASVEQDSDRSTGIRLTGGVVTLLLAGAVAAAVYWLFQFTDAERQRDLRMWQVRLGIVAESRAEAVQSWLDDQLDTVAKLAENPSLRLYLTEISLGQTGDGSPAEAAGQAEYLRNLLIATASRSGFEGPLLGPDVSANVEHDGVAGIAVIETGGRFIAATPAMPLVDDRLRTRVTGEGTGGPRLADLFIGATGRPALAFSAPVHAIQDNPGEDAAIGHVIAIRLMDDALFKRLDQPGDVDNEAETYLVRRNGATVDYLSPLADGSGPLERALALDTPELAAAFALAAPGGFGRYVDYRGKPVLVTGRRLDDVPWTVVRTVPVALALGPGEARRDGMLLVLVLVIFGLAATILLVWRHASSLRSAEAAEKYRAMSERFASLSRFLRIVADGQPTAIATLDADGRYSFANRKAAREVGASEREIVGKSMVDVLGPARAALFEPLNHEAVAAGRAVFKTQTVPAPAGPCVIKSAHIPLPPEDGRNGEVLMILEDITELVHERERRENNLRHLVTTIMGIIDRRDPFAALHSTRVGEVAEAIAQEMGLPERDVETAEIAGSLMNLGKILVPKQVLTATGSLSAEDLEAVRVSILSSADLLQTVEFDGPVIATIRQVYARWDGAGTPEGLKGEDILVTARVVSVANCFVGMVGARARRSGKSFDEAVDYLVAHVGRIFDRRPVAALVNILDNRDGRGRWSAFSRPPVTGEE